MSVQAYSWAIEQSDVPARPALVLIALANHASHVDGRCWPSIETIAREARCSRRAVFGYVAALERNGYVEVERTRKKSGRQGTNNYWLLFNRDKTPWAHLPDDRDLEPPISAEDAEAVEENNSTCGESGEAEAPIQSANPAPLNEPKIDPPECKASAPGQSATCCTPHVMLEPSDSRTLEQGEIRGLKVGPPIGYRPTPRIERAAASMASEGSKPTPVFVWEGTDAWKYWIAVKAQERGPNWRGCPIPKTTHNGRTGWWFPSLYPPKSGDRMGERRDDPSPENQILADEFNASRR